MVLLMVAAVWSRTPWRRLLDRVESLAWSRWSGAQRRGGDDRALEAGAKVLDVNARNRTRSRWTDMFSRLAPGLPFDTYKVGESGVRSRANLMTYAGVGRGLVLVGESLITSGDPKAAVTNWSPPARIRLPAAER